MKFCSYRHKGTFKRFRKLYDYMVLPGHQKAYFDNSLVSFVSSGLKKDFLVNPMTYYLKQDYKKFIIDEEEDDFKHSIKDLFSKYGKPGNSFLDKKTLSPNHFNDEFFKKVLDFQEHRSSETEEIKEKYQIEKEEEGELLGFIPAYFGFEVVDSDWFELNLDSLDYAASEYDKGDKKLYPMIVTSKDTIAKDNNRKEIINRYSNFSEEIESVLIWIDNWKQEEVNRNRINDLIKFVNGFKEKGIEVIIMYAGFYEALLGVSGICHGVFYTENKKIEFSSGGGLVPKRYYLEPLHTFRNINEIRKKIDKLKGGGLIEKDTEIKKEITYPELEEEKREKLIQHFLSSRKRELENIGRGYDYLNELRNNLKKSKGILKDIDFIGKWTEELEKSGLLD